MDDIVATLARNVRLARQRVGLSQEALADAAEIDRTYVSGIERGIRNPTIVVVQKLATVLGTTASALLAK